MNLSTQSRQQSVGKGSIGDPSVTTDCEIMDEWETASDSSLVKNNRVKSHSGTDSNSVKGGNGNQSMTANSVGNSLAPNVTSNNRSDYYQNEANTSNSRNQLKSNRGSKATRGHKTTSGRQYAQTTKQQYDIGYNNSYDYDTYSSYPSNNGRQRGNGNGLNRSRNTKAPIANNKNDDLRYTAKYWTDSSATTTVTATATNTTNSKSNDGISSTTTTSVNSNQTSKFYLKNIVFQIKFLINNTNKIISTQTRS